MINEIIMQGQETCYKKETKLNCSHKVNVIYGLNGVGKSTLSTFLSEYPNKSERFINCDIKTLKNDEELLVYNQDFINKNFYESENQIGIFSLRSENKKALTAIENATKEIGELNQSLSNETNKLEKKLSEISQNKKQSESKTWEIKTKYTGGDRILDLCFDGLSIKGSSDKLFEYLINVPLSPEEIRPVEEIKKDIQLYSDKEQQEISFLDKCNFTGYEIEKNLLFSKIIIGNQTSTFSDVINQLNNSDWVKKGVEYLPHSIISAPVKCPFCQSNTITNDFIKTLNDYFDESYIRDRNAIEQLYTTYIAELENIPSESLIDNCLPAEPFKEKFKTAVIKLESVVRENIETIKTKLDTPSIPITLKNTEELYLSVKQLIEQINTSIDEYNKKIRQRDENLKLVKNEFWLKMRLEYDSCISLYQSENTRLQKEKASIENQIRELNSQISEQKEIISINQALTVNIDDAIKNINNSLIDLGISDFSIKKHEEKLYSIIRNDDDKPIFKTLSEGEKMVISFLYFIELCRGKTNVEEAPKKKIVVIDDPISSLSHIFVYNIGRLIQNEFIRSDKYEQLIVLSHSLYFLYELMDNSPKNRDKYDEKMFRIVKNLDGSKFQEMHYEEIQNDYHSYWTIVRDANQNPALVANCMRNIIDYFFNFVEKTDFNNVFQKEELKNTKYQAFNRYINRESHSLGQNIFDIKEFDYDIFLEAFKLIFTTLGYEEHYEKMMNL